MLSERVVATVDVGGVEGIRGNGSEVNGSVIDSLLIQIIHIHDDNKPPPRCRTKLPFPPIHQSYMYIQVQLARLNACAKNTAGWNRCAKEEVNANRVRSQKSP